MPAMTSLTGESVPAEVLARTRRLWLRSADVALGLWGAARPVDLDAAYWKWNRREGRWRGTQLLKDRKIFGDDGSTERPPASARILTYKPESRLGWRVTEDETPCFVKAYAPAKFERAAARARGFDRHAGSAGMKLLRVDEATNRISWRWIEGRKGSASRASIEDALSLASDFHGLGIVGALHSIPKLGPAEIAAHLRSRVEAFGSWRVPLLPESGAAVEAMEKQADEPIGRLEEWGEPIRPSLLHGDLRPKNVLIDQAGQPRLCDADHLALGDREWDFAAWIADALTDDPAAEARIGEFFIDNAKLDPIRLKVYVRVWRILLTMAGIEEEGSA